MQAFLGGFSMNKTVKTLMFWVAIALSAVLLWTVIKSNPGSKMAEISYSDFLSEVEARKVAKVTLSRAEAVATRTDHSIFRVSIPLAQEGMLQSLHQNNVEIWVTHSDDTTWTNWTFNLILPIVVLVGLWFFMIRQIQAAVRAKTKTPADTRPPNVG